MPRGRPIGECSRAVLRYLVRAGIGRPVETVQLAQTLGLSRDAVHAAMERCAARGLVLLHKPTRKVSRWSVTAAGAQALDGPAEPAQPSRKTITKAQRALAAEQRLEEAAARALSERMSAWQPLPHSTAAHALSALRAIGPGHPVDVRQLASWIAVDDVRDLDEALAPAVQADRVRRYPSPHDCRRSCYALVAQVVPAVAAPADAQAVAS